MRDIHTLTLIQTVCMIHVSARLSWRDYSLDAASIRRCLSVSSSLFLFDVWLTFTFLFHDINGMHSNIVGIKSVKWSTCFCTYYLYLIYMAVECANCDTSNIKWTLFPLSKFSCMVKGKKTKWMLCLCICRFWLRSQDVGSKSLQMVISSQIFVLKFH